MTVVHGSVAAPSPWPSADLPAPGPWLGPADAGSGHGINQLTDPCYLLPSDRRDLNDVPSLRNLLLGAMVLRL